LCFCDGGKRYGFSGRGTDFSLKKNKRKGIYIIVFLRRRALRALGLRVFVAAAPLFLPVAFFVFCVRVLFVREFAAGLPRLRGAVGIKRIFVCLVVLPGGLVRRLRLVLPASLPAGGGGALRPVFPAGGVRASSKEKRQLLYYARSSRGPAAGRRCFRSERRREELPRRLRVYPSNIPRRNNTRRL